MAAGCLNAEAVNGETVFRGHDGFAHTQEGAYDHLDEFVRAVADDDPVTLHPEFLGQPLLEVEGVAVGIAVQVGQRRTDRCDRLGRRTQRVFVGGDLHRVGDPVLALDLFDRLAGLVGGEARHPLGDVAAEIHDIIAFALWHASLAPVSSARPGPLPRRRSWGRMSRTSRAP